MKKHIFKILRFSGFPFLFREFIQSSRVSILLFHEINKETAEKTFSYLSKRYNIIDLNDFLFAYNKKDKFKIPKKSLIITFDDGHVSNFEILPIVKKYNIPITIFLCSSIINTKRQFWFKLTNNSISKSALKQKSNKERLEILSKIGFVQEKEYDDIQALQKDHIEKMKNYINMQSHTMFHPILPKCDNDEAREEIFNSKKILEKEYNLKINTIAYPNGDYTERDIVLCKEAGYTCGLTVDYGFNTFKTDLFHLKRLSMNDAKDINEIIVRSSGSWQFLKQFKMKK